MNPLKYDPSHRGGALAHKEKCTAAFMGY